MTVNWLWVRSPLEEMKYLFKFVFPFLRPGAEGKRGVELRHLTQEIGYIAKEKSIVQIFYFIPIKAQSE